MRLRDFNGFIVSSIILFGLAIGGLVKGNRWLSEPGMPVNEYAWQLYLLASVIMLINGIISIRLTRRAERERAAQKVQSSADSGQKSNN